jgi:uncharacterized protein (DUF2062 family)
MIRFPRDLARRWLEALLHVDDSPERTAAAFSMGVFFGFSPLLGLHTLLALACAFLFNLNRVAVLLGVYSNLPWFLAPYYTFATMGGAKLLGVNLPPGFARRLRTLFELSLLQSEFWHRLWSLLRPLLWPYTLGSTMGALILAAVAYFFALGFVETKRRHLQRMHWKP